MTDVNDADVNSLQHQHRAAIKPQLYFILTTLLPLIVFKVKLKTILIAGTGCKPYAINPTFPRYLRHKYIQNNSANTEFGKSN